MFEQETTLYHPQVIINIISLSLYINHFHITHDSQERDFFQIHNPNGFFCEFGYYERIIYYIDIVEKKMATQ